MHITLLWPRVVSSSNGVWGNMCSWQNRAGLCFCFMALSCWRPEITLFALVCGRVSSLCIRRDSWGEKVKESERFVFCSFERCLGTTRQRPMDTWTSWKRPRGRTSTLRMRMAWLPPYWLLSMDMSMLFSSYAAESKHYTLLSITSASSHTQRNQILY